MSTKYSRTEKLYGLAVACNLKNLSPDHPAYKGYIIAICTSKFGLSHDAATDLAKTLTSAYRADKWVSITEGITNEEITEASEESPSNDTPQSLTKYPPFPTLKTFKLNGPCTPIKTIAPKHEAQPDLDTPHNQALTLLNLAQHDQWNHTGRVTLAQARYELNDKSLRLEDVLSLLKSELPAIEFETRPGNTIYVYFDGKSASKTKQPVIVQSMAPLMYAALEDNTTQIEELDEESDIPEEE
jgi:hypothetical protein